MDIIEPEVLYVVIEADRPMWETVIGVFSDEDEAKIAAYGGNKRVYESYTNHIQVQKYKNKIT